jgi:hypothetical protein
MPMKELLRAAFIKEGAVKIEHPASGAVAYYSGNCECGKVYAVGFRRDAETPAFNYSFRSEARRAAWVEKWFSDEADG